MEDLEKIKACISDCKDMVIDGAENVKEILQNIWDDPIEIVKYAFIARNIVNFLKEKAPLLHSELKFWDNVDKFFNSGVLDDKDKEKFIRKLSEDENKKNTGKKLIDIIEKINTDKKMAYILNATKILLTNDSLGLNLYFRICHTILRTLEEDLEFLNRNIEKNFIRYSVEVSGLITSGLAYDKGISEDKIPCYAFNKFAEVINEYALKGNGEKKIEEFNLNRPPQTYFLTTANVANDEDIQKMLDEILGDNAQRA